MNRLLITLDYELFFGPVAGTVKRCLVEPTAALAAVAERHGARLTLFVDAGHLRASREHQDAAVRREADTVRRQLAALSARGHDIQLHIHPHWEDSVRGDGGWQFDMSRYRLHEFSPAEQQEIVAAYKAELCEVAARPVFAYRAGGWCLQPFAKIAAALQASDIWLDSTVFDGGLSDDQERHFDFRHAPAAPAWRFSADPMQPDPGGYFYEVPISSMALGPLAYWLMALLPRLSGRFRSMGDGSGMKWSRQYYLARLFGRSVSPASIDGIKGRFFRQKFSRRRRTDPEATINVMGHPKAISRASVDSLGRFLAARDVVPCTLQDFASFAPAARAA